MRFWARVACACAGAGLWLALPLHAAEEGTAPASKPPSSGVVVDVRTDRIVLMDVEAAANRLVAVGERGFTLVSEDGGHSWKGLPTPVSRTLTGLAFEDGNLGVAVGHGGTLIRTEDAGRHWTQVTLEEAGTDSLLGVTSLGSGHFAAYGAFGLYFDSKDGGRTWQRVTVIGEDFDRHISQVIAMGSSLLLVAESGALAKSDDGGATWVALTSPYEGSYFGALALDDGAVLAFGMRGNVFRTADHGATWQKIETGTTTSIMSGRQLADGRVLLVGNAGLLALSRDRGQTLELHTARPAKGISSFVEAGDRIILAGEGGVTVLDPAWLATR